MAERSHEQALYQKMSGSNPFVTALNLRQFQPLNVAAIHSVLEMSGGYLCVKIHSVAACFPKEFRWYFIEQHQAKWKFFEQNDWRQHKNNILPAGCEMNKTPVFISSSSNKASTSRCYTLLIVFLQPQWCHLQGGSLFTCPLFLQMQVTNSN